MHIMQLRPPELITFRYYQPAYMPSPITCYPKTVQVEDISRAYSLFIDVQRSSQYMVEFAGQYLYNEAGEEEEEGDALQAMSQ